MVQFIFERVRVLKPIAAILASFASIIPDSQIYTRYGVAVGGLLLFAFITVAGRDRIHSYKPKSPELEEFFRNWYLLPGRLSIYCTDLDWLQDGSCSALLAKSSSGELRLFLQDHTGNQLRLEQLERAGATIVRVPPDLATDVRFSVRENDGTKWIIVRSKDHEESGQVAQHFIETTSVRDPYLVSLALSLLRVCDDKKFKL